MERTSLQAATDPLTGLLNRRTLENRVYELLQRAESFASPTLEELLKVADLNLFRAKREGRNTVRCIQIN